MTLKKRSTLLQAFEVVLLTVALVGIGYYIDPKDSLLIHYDFSFLILWLAVVTLFYGLAMGLVMWITFAGVTTFLYLEDPIYITVLLENLAFVFLFGLFFSNVHSEIDKYKIQNRYFQLRLKELTSAFFTLKISHDKLESIYITQPASFRFVIAEVLESCEHNTAELSAKNSLKVLQKFFSVNSAMIFRVKKRSVRQCFASIGDIDTHINKDDKLIEEVLLQKKAIYLKDLDEKEQTSYIYAVPFLDKRNSVVALLIVKEIPFLFYNEDTLLKINVVFTYIWTEYKKRASLDRLEAEGKKEGATPLIYEHHERQEIVDFKLEVARLNNILEGFNVESRIYAISTNNEYLFKEIQDFLYLNEDLEILDEYISIECSGAYIHFILFPFVSLPDMYKRAKNLDEKLSKIEIFEEGLEESLGKRGFSSIETKHISVKNFKTLLEEYGCV
jgi:hypothetical protein